MADNSKRDPSMPERGGRGSRTLPVALVDTVAGILDAFKNGWFGPGEPLQPIAPPDTDPGRNYDYPMGFNLLRQPRADEGLVTFSELRSLAKGAELVTLAVETRKDQAEKIKWRITPKANPGEKKSELKTRAANDQRVTDITKFMEYPDKELPWNMWLRKLLDDALVIDAATIYCRRNKAGGIYSLEVLDGALISRLLDEKGRTPLPPNFAYQQYIKGMPAFSYTTEELLYLPRNPRTNCAYGFSPVEQIILHMNILLNRNLSQLAQYTASNIPMMFLKTPKEWKPKDIAEFQKWFDSVLSGNIEEKSKAIAIPDAADPIAPKKDALKDEGDEWLARFVCYAFGLSPNFFIRQQNRASSESYLDQADDEGMQPWLSYVKVLMDWIIVRWFEADDLEFEWIYEKKAKPLEQAQIHKLYADAKILTSDEIREELGYDPLTQEQKDELKPPVDPSAFGGDQQDGGDPKPRLVAPTDEDRARKFSKTAKKIKKLFAY